MTYGELLPGDMLIFSAIESDIIISTKIVGTEGGLYNRSITELHMLSAGTWRSGVHDNRYWSRDTVRGGSVEIIRDGEVVWSITP